MSNSEWAQLFSAVGFSGYALVTGVVLFRYLRTNTFANVRRLLVSSSLFVVLIGLASATSALSRPPFEWLTPSQAAQVTPFYVWVSFFGLLGYMGRRSAGQ